LNPEQIKEQEMTLSRQKKGKESAVEKRLREAKEKEQKKNDEILKKYLLKNLNTNSNKIKKFIKLLY
jgi:guanylate kinase